MTSGNYANGEVLWEADNIFHTGETFWAMQIWPETEGRIAYTYGGGNVTTR